MLIYKTTNLITGKIYIGQTTLTTPGYLGSGKWLKNSIKKYGKYNFIRETLEVCNSLEELNIKEEYWINFFDARNENVGYNIAPGGGGGNLKYWLGKKMPTEMCKKISQTKKGIRTREVYNFPLDMQKDRYKAVLQYDLKGTFIKEWKNISEANKIYNTNGDISCCCKGKKHSCKGFVWIYKDLSKSTEENQQIVNEVLKRRLLGIKSRY